MLTTNKHPVIVPTIGFYEEKSFGYIVQIKIENGDLGYVLEEMRKNFKISRFDETQKLIISYGISCVMEFLHHKSIIHRNLACRNILIDADLHPYLTGFSLSKQIDESRKIEDNLEYSTAITMAPEFIKEPEIYRSTFLIDVYSYGMVIYELMSELRPFSHLKSNYQILTAVASGQRPPIPDSVPKNWRDLIERCFSADPLERPTFTEICDLLESDEFVNDRIDRERFENYKKTVKPFRPSSQNDKENTNQNEDLKKQLSKIQSELDESKSTIKKLEGQLKKAKAEAFNPFEEQENASNADENYFVDEEDQQFYKTVKKIGEGATSIVYKVIDTRTSQVICKKVLKMSDESSSFKNAQNAMKEFEVLRMILHPCICKAYKINIQEPVKSDTDDQDDSSCTTISLYLEFIPRSLKNCIEEKVLDNTLKARIAVEVAHALNFIHKHKMIHRDVKIENIMLNSIFEAKVVDFGLVRIDECFSGQSFVASSMTKGVGTHILHVA